MTKVRQVWLLSAPVPSPNFSPEIFTLYGPVRSIFRPREPACHNPEAAFARLYAAFKDDFKNGDYVAWVGGDTLIAILAGAALITAGVNEWTWLRYIGRGEYQQIPIAFDGSSGSPTDMQHTVQHELNSIPKGTT